MARSRSPLSVPSSGADRSSKEHTPATLPPPRRNRPGCCRSRLGITIPHCSDARNLLFEDMRLLPLRTLLICAALATAVVGCGKNPEPPPKVAAELATEKERAKNAEAQRAEEARKRAAAEKEASSLKTTVMVLVVCVGVALIVGVGIGSRARKKADPGHDS